MPSTLNPQLSTTPQPTAILRPPSSGFLQRWLPIAVFSVLWLDLFRLLSTQWETREQYAYGWFVPLFVAALLWRRWIDRPGSGLSDHGTTGQQVLPQVSGFILHPSSRFLLSAFCFLLCLLLLPLRVIYEINTDWPLISWLYTFIVVVATLYAFSLAGGWHWVRHFAFPVCFILVAVVWPYRMEKGLTQDLMQVVASLTVELLGWLDIPALQRGNLIELGTGTVGVDEACSGIRSFQSSLMAALLMGEFYRLRLLPRAALVVSGITLGFCFNVVRTLLLSYQANQQGLGAIAKWHDPAGFTIAVACSFCLWAIAVLITKWTKRRAPLTSDLRPLTSGISDPQPSVLNPQPPKVRGQRSEASGQRSAVNSPQANSLSSVLHPPSSVLWRRFALAVGCWSLLSIATTEAWYRSHTNPNSGKFYWNVAMPETAADFQKIELPPRTLELLKFDSGTTGKWTENGMEWSGHFFRWKPRSVESVITSRIHRPERCLPAAGFSQVSESELVWYDAGQFKLPFRKYVFQAEGRTLFVFFCQWEDGFKDQAGMQASNQADRLQSVLSGRRLVGQQTLELILSGCPSLDAAEQAVRNRLPTLIRPDV